MNFGGSISRDGVKWSAVIVGSSFLILSMVEKGQDSLWSLYPPFLAVVLAFLTRNIFVSLGISVLVGTFLLRAPDRENFLDGLGLSFETSLAFAWSSLSHKDNLLILGFVALVLMTVQIMQGVGGISAFMSVLSRWVKGPRSAQWVTYLMGLALFIDDYTNTMVVGASMRRLTDRYRVSREKLAFLVDATSAPVAGVAVVSTWIGFEVGLFNEFAREFELGVDGYGLFFEALPYRFYCFLMLAFTAIMLWFDFDFGPMKKAQDRSAEGRGTGSTMEGREGSYEDGEVFRFDQALDEGRHRKWALALGILPLFSLVLYVFSNIYIRGAGSSWGWGGIFNFRAWYDAITNLETGLLILFEASVLGFVLALVTALVVIYLRSRSSVPLLFSRIGVITAAMKSFILPVSILLLAWSLKEVVVGLEAGAYLSKSIVGGVHPVLFPVSVFVLAGVMAFATGTSWGTMAILIPILAPVAFHMGEATGYLLVPMTLAAILDGAIMGDHCSPISDTTLMSSLSTECDLIEHVRTQMPYCLLVGFVALFGGYLLSMFVSSQWLVWCGVLGSLFLAVSLIYWNQKRQSV